MPLQTRSVVLLLMTALLVPALPAQAEGGVTWWSWQSEGLDGGFATRLTLDFSDGAACVLRFTVRVATVADGAELMILRDDGAGSLLIADVKAGGSSGAFWNLPGETDLEMTWGEIRDIVVVNRAEHSGVEAWIFVGQGLVTQGGAAPPAYALSLECDHAFVVMGQEAAREVASFTTANTCDATANLPVYVCGVGYAVAQTGSWQSTGPRTVMIYLQDTLLVDVGHVILEGPGVQAQSAQVATSLTGLVWLRIESGPGQYGYMLTHLAGTYLAGGLVIGFHPVADMAEAENLPTFG